MIDTARMIAARPKATPVPGMGEQVALDLKDTVSSAAESAEDFLGHLPQIVSRLLLSAVVLIVGLLILKLGKMIIAKLARKRGKNSRINTHGHSRIA